jgi:hypothetical protein
MSEISGFFFIEIVHVFTYANVPVSVLIHVIESLSGQFLVIFGQMFVISSSSPEMLENNINHILEPYLIA